MFLQNYKNKLRNKFIKKFRNKVIILLKLLQKFRWITQIEAEKVAQWLVGEGQAATYRKICKTISDNLMTQGAYDVITEREQTLLL